MPISLRLPEAVEQQIAGYCARQGRSKSAVIVQSIQEFLAKNAEPTSQEIYEEAMRTVSSATESSLPSSDTGLSNIDHRKPAFREAVERKHLQRSKLALKALKVSVNANPKGSKSA